MAFFNDRKAGFLEKLLDLFAREIGAVKTFGFVPLYGIAMHQTGYDHKSTAHAQSEAEKTLADFLRPLSVSGQHF